jgi:HAD superfamily hydrolase (TIGR01509 family)
VHSLQAVVFDLDGLLVDSEPVWYEVRTVMFGRFGLSWTDDDQKALMGRSTAAWIEYVAEKLEGKLTREEISHETIRGMVTQYQAGNVRVMPGADGAIRYCAGNYSLGLASGSPKVLIDAALRSNRWEDLFPEIVSSDEVPQGKPAPDVYEKAFRQLGVDPWAAVVVEDSESGILAGKAAHASVIAVPNERLMPSPAGLRAADIVIPSLRSIDDALRTIQQSS